MNTSAIRLSCFLLVLGMLSSCKVLDQANEMRTFAKCDFRLKEVSKVSLAGVDVTGVDQFSDLNFSQASNISMNAMKGELPLFMVLDIEVRNPNDQKASMNRFLWELYVDDQLITNGKVTKDLKVPPDGGTAVLPVDISMDLFEVLTGESADAIINFGMNLSGNGTGVPSRIKLRAKPTIYVAMTLVDYPGWITVEQEFGSE